MLARKRHLLPATGCNLVKNQPPRIGAPTVAAVIPTPATDTGTRTNRVARRPTLRQCLQASGQTKLKSALASRPAASLDDCTSAWTFWLSDEVYQHALGARLHPSSCARYCSQFTPFGRMEHHEQELIARQYASAPFQTTSRVHHIAPQVSPELFVMDGSDEHCSMFNVRWSVKAFRDALRALLRGLGAEDSSPTLDAYKHREVARSCVFANFCGIGRACWEYCITNQGVLQEEDFGILKRRLRRLCDVRSIVILND